MGVLERPSASTWIVVSEPDGQLASQQLPVDIRQLMCLIVVVVLLKRSADVSKPRTFTRREFYVHQLLFVG